MGKICQPRVVTAVSFQAEFSAPGCSSGRELAHALGLAPDITRYWWIRSQGVSDCRPAALPLHADL
jgi:hypothetical protein